MAIETDIAIDTSGNIYYTGTAHGVAGAGYYTVIELHRFLQDLADDAAATGNDLISIVDATPSDRSTDNIITLNTGYRLDDGQGTDAITEHLFDGSIIQLDEGSIYDGLVVIASEGMDLQIIQNGAIVVDDFWNTVPNGESLKGLNRDVANGISHRFMLRVNNAGSEIDGRRIVGITREMGKTYSEFKVNGTARGNNVLALTYSNDLNNATAKATVATWSAIDLAVEGYVTLDIDGNGAEPFFGSWDRDKDNRSINQFYERMKWVSECASGTTDGTANDTIYGLAANLFRGITHEIALNTGTQSVTDFSAFEAVSWTGGTGQMLAIDDVNAGTKMWIQLLTGAAPGVGVTITGVTSTATIDTHAATTPVERAISTPFCGQSTGSALIGSYGFALQTSDTSSADLFTDLNNGTNQPPNNVTFTVNGVIHDEDRVLVGPEDGSGGLRVDQAVVNTGNGISITTGTVTSTGLNAGEVLLAGDGVGASTGTEAIGTGTPSADDTPTAGTIRVVDNAGVYQIINYTGTTIQAGAILFTGCSADAGLTATLAAGNNGFISYIDTLAVGATVAYSAVIEGTEYEIKTSGDANWVAMGAADTNVGTRFTKNATAPSGTTGDAYAVSTSQSYTVVFSNGNPRSLFIRVRDGGTTGDATGIKTFETTGTLGSAGGSTTAIRTADA